MNSSFSRFGGYGAILVGIFSILYAVLYLLVTRVAPDAGALGSWLALSVSGLFSSAAYLALYARVRAVDSGFALWVALLGVAASLLTFTHGAFETLLLIDIQKADPTQLVFLKALSLAPSQVDPAGLATFLLTGLVVFTFSYLISQSKALPKGLATLGMVNGVVLAVLFFATAASVQTLILISGGLTSVILGPIWWIWLGMRLIQPQSVIAPTGAMPSPPTGPEHE